MTKEALLEEISEIYTHLAGNLPSEAPGLVLEIDQCNVWLARSSQLMADAEYFYNQRRGEYADKQAKLALSERLSATLFKEMLSDYTKDQERTYTLAERLNNTLTKRIESARSLLSYEKQLIGA